MTTEPESQKPTVRRRRSATRRGQNTGMPRVMWLALLICVAGAVALFRSGGGDHPTGLGEYQTVVTAPDVEFNLSEQDAAHRSGEVDISDQGLHLTPETPVAGERSVARDDSPLTFTVPAESPPTGGNLSSEPAASEPAADAATPAKSTVATTPAPARTAAPGPRLAPQPAGPYVAQVGSFSSTENAQKEVARLKKAGLDALVKVGNTADGALTYRVQIGYFAARVDAERFITQNSRYLSGAIPAHR